MKQNERLFDSNQAMFSTAMQTLQSQANYMNDEIHKLRTENAELRAKISSMDVEEGKNFAEAAAKARSDARKDKALAKMLQLAPVVIAHYAGKETPGSPSPTTLLVSELAQSLSQDQMFRIGMLLSPEQRIILGKLIEIANTAVPPRDPSQETSS